MTQPLRVRVLLVAGALALLAVAFSGDRFWLQFLGKAMITCIFAMSLDLLVGYTGLVSLAHASFFGLSAYLLAGLSNRLGWVNPLLTLPLCLVFAALAAAAIGWLSLRASGVYFIMVTLAFTQMLYYLFNDAPAFGGSDGLYVNDRPRLGALDFGERTVAYVAIWIALVLVYLALLRILRAPFGHVLVGIRGNEQRMRSLGYPTGRYKLVAFVLAGALAGLAGYLDATLYGFVNPAHFSWRQSGLLLMTVLLGGKGTLYGPMLGALLLTFLEHYGEQVTSHWNALIGVFVIVVVLVLPRGIAGLLRGARG
ncbi:MAG: branched-chain amino acid ABC transporter permease [Myxococcales bacterium]